MRDLPRGTVTFLFTDIEGSTRLLKQLGERYGEVLAEHQRLLRAAFQEAGGREIDTQGDSFFYVFARAKDALAAAVAGQRALAEHAWPRGAKVRVRMGLHSGEPAPLGEERYVGMGVHKAARIASAAHGGQILLSRATRELVADDLPPRVRIVDLGEQQLKDFDRPEQIFQLDAPRLPHRFPPLRTDAPLPRSRFRRRPRTRIPRPVLLGVVVALALGGLAAGLALALTGERGNHGSPAAGGEEGPVAPGNDPSTIVPGKSIGAVKLGMTKADIEALYGPGADQDWRGRGRTGTRTVFPAPEGSLSVAFYGGKVVQVGTTSSYYVTRDGIRVGSLPPDQSNRKALEDSLQRGALIEVSPGVYSWRNFIYENLAYCLRSSDSATQLMLKGGAVARVLSIYITKTDFLADLPVHQTGGFFSGDYYCSEKPLQR